MGLIERRGKISLSNYEANIVNAYEQNNNNIKNI
jgi:hypothetical protein